jgi:hypothetical protein
MRRKIAVKQNLTGCGRTRLDAKGAPVSLFKTWDSPGQKSIGSVLKAEPSGRRSFSEFWPRNAREVSAGRLGVYLVFSAPLR